MIQGVNVNGVTHKIDYESLENLPDLSKYEEKLVYDNAPTPGSQNLLTSGDIYTALENYTPGGSSIGEVDSSVQEGSDNPVSSNAVYGEVETLNLRIDDVNNRITDEIEALQTQTSADLNTKVDKEDGKDLSTNDFTDNYKNNLVKIINRQFEGVLPYPTAALDLCIPIVKDGRWVYQMIDDIIPNAESGEF